MKIRSSVLIAVSTLTLQEVSLGFKTTSPERVPFKNLTDRPYRHNGAVVYDDARGSGFHAWHPKTYFSAAHVVFNQGDTDQSDTSSWRTPPTWYPGVHNDTLDGQKSINTRGYIRWASYGRFAATGKDADAFGKDVVVGYAFRRLNSGKPAKIDLTGAKTLRDGKRFMITGYPAENSYFGQPISGFFMHQTGPMKSSFLKQRGEALRTTLITTGGGNSGGPVWVRNKKRQWVAAGVLTGGLPSETVIYGFSDKLRPMLNAVKPLVQKPSERSLLTGGTDSYAYSFPFRKRTVLPDGARDWKGFRIEAGLFGRGEILKEVRLDLDIKTKHQGDLQVLLVAPDGSSALVHNQEGADTKNLKFKRKDLSASFLDIDPFGSWVLRIRDGIKGDTAILRSFRLELVLDQEIAVDTATP